MMEEVKVMVILDSILREIDKEQFNKDEYVSNESFERLERIKDKVLELGENFGVWKVEQVKRLGKIKKEIWGVGDLVRVKPYNQLVHEFGVPVQGECGAIIKNIPYGYVFNMEMAKYCGKVLKIGLAGKDRFLLEDKEGDVINEIFTIPMLEKVKRNEELERIREIINEDIDEEEWEEEDV